MAKRHPRDVRKRKSCLIRRWTVTDAARHDGSMLPGRNPVAETPTITTLERVRASSSRVTCRSVKAEIEALQLCSIHKLRQLERRYVLAKQTHEDTHESRPVTIGGSEKIASHAVRDFVEKDGGLNTVFRDSDLQPARVCPCFLGIFGYRENLRRIR
jgi:hypothetical protein